MDEREEDVAAVIYVVAFRPSGKEVRGEKVRSLAEFLPLFLRQSFFWRWERGTNMFFFPVSYPRMNLTHTVYVWKGGLYENCRNKKPPTHVRLPEKK